MMRIHATMALRFAERCAGKAALGTATLATRSAIRQVLACCEDMAVRGEQVRRDIGHYDHGALPYFDYVQILPVVRRAAGLVYMVTMADEREAL